MRIARLLSLKRNKRICYVGMVDAKLVLVRGIFPVIVRLKSYVIMVRNQVITFLFVIGVTTRTRHCVQAVAPTMVIVMSRKTSIKPAVLVPPFM